MQKILIIDNDSKVIKSLKKVIEENYEIHTTTKPKEAIKIIKSKKIDLIISNQYMADLTGIEVLEQAKNIDSKIIRILMSDYSDINIIISGINNNIINYYIEKPWQDDDIISIIKAGLQRKIEYEAKEKIIEQYQKAQEDHGEESDAHGENMRRFFRNELFIPLCSDMTIVEINGKRIHTNSAKTCVVNIGPGGIRFVSGLSLNNDIDVLLRFEMKILDVDIEFEGYVVWKDQYRFEKDIYQYGIEFKIDELYRTELIKVLNEMSVRISKNVRIDKSTTCPKTNIISCLKSNM